jgi:hypothetical protein
VPGQGQDARRVSPDMKAIDHTGRLEFGGGIHGSCNYRSCLVCTCFNQLTSCLFSVCIFVYLAVFS